MKEAPYKSHSLNGNGHIPTIAALYVVACSKHVTLNP